MNNNDWKSKLGMVYSTNPDFKIEIEEEEIITPLPSSQKLRVCIDRRNRGGKQVTLVLGFNGKDEDLSELSKILKTKCGVGGAAKDGEIIIQGDFRDKILKILLDLGYNAKRGN